MSKIARVKFIRDKEPNIKALTAKNKVLDGALYVATDTGTLWMGISSSSLIQIKDNINTNTTYNLTKSGNSITLTGSDGGSFSVTDSNTVYGNATSSAAGLMSAADKAKLDGVAAGSNHVTVDATLSADSTNPVQNKVIKTALDGKSNTGHTHDDRYYTETEMNTKLAAKANSSHTHTKSQITDFPTSMPASDVYSWAKQSSKPSYTIGEVSGNLPASRISGTISSANLPSYVDDVLEGYLSGGKFYKTKGSDGSYSGKITAEAGKIYVDLSNNKTYRWSGSAYVVISETIALGTTHSTAGYGDESRAAYNHSTKTGNPHGTTKADLGLSSVENKSSATIRGELTKANVTTALGYTPPTTDTNTWRPIQNNLTSTATDQSLSAAQGKILNDKFASYVPTSRTVNGKALSGNITLSAGDIGAAAASHSHSYLPLSGGTVSGNIHFASIGDKAKAAGITWDGSTDGAGIYYETRGADSGHLVLNMTDDANVTVDIAAGGAVQSYFDYSGTFHGNVSGNASSASSVAWSNVSGRPSSMPASDVYSWAKASSKPSYTWSEIGSKPTFATVATSGNYNDLSNKPSIPSVGNGTVTITQNGTTKGSFTLNQSGNATIALTDNNTVYSLPAATSSTLGGVKVGSNITNSSGTISLTKANVTAALGYTPPTSDTNTWRPEEVIISSTQPSASTCKLWIKI